MTATSEQARRKFHTLDGMRGVAAILVVTRHGAQYVAPLEFPNSFLAVDLFFMLSGFVVASAYDARLASGALTPLRFMLVRFIRLWPLYLLGTLLGAVVLYFKILHGKSDVDMGTFWRVLPGQLVMLPSPGTRDLYTVNLVAWSLFFELFINAAFAAFHRILSTPVLLAVAALSVVGMVAGQQTTGSLNNGWLWKDAWVSFARVGFAFPVGVLLFRYHARLPRLGISPSAVLVGLAVVLTTALPEPINDAAQFLTIIVMFPLLVTAAVEVEPAPNIVPVFTWLGVTSYAVYTLHNPILTIFEYGLSKLGIVFSDYSPWSGFAGIAIIALIAWAADRFYDTPMRAWLTARTRPRARPAAAFTAR